MKSHADELLMASIRKLTNCIDFHSLTASVHMSIFKSPCGVTICNGKLLWLWELDVVLAQGLLTQTKFPWWELRLVYKLIPWLPHRERRRGSERSFVNPQQRSHAFFSFRDVHSCKRSDRNVYGPFSPEHIRSNVPSVFFSRKRWNPRKHRNVTGEKCPGNVLRVQSWT